MLIGSVLAAPPPTPDFLASGPSPFAPGCNGVPQTGTLYPNAEVEPFVAANPHRPMNLVGVWQQDRWSDGGSQGLGTEYSFVKRLLDHELDIITLDPSTAAIGDDIDLLVVAGPRRPFEDRARRAIEDSVTAARPTLFLIDGMSSPGDGDDGADHNRMIARSLPTGRPRSPPPWAITGNRRFIIETFNRWVSERFVPLLANPPSDHE